MPTETIAGQRRLDLHSSTPQAKQLRHLLNTVPEQEYLRSGHLSDHIIASVNREQCFKGTESMSTKEVQETLTFLEWKYPREFR